MLRIGNIIFSFDILEKKFKCDLSSCLGNCCRYGDSGAPLTDEEVLILDDIWPEVKPYIRKEGIGVIENEGTSIVDFENDRVTPLVGNEECAYAVLDGSIYMCGIERAWHDNKINFRKPLSCHLFPVRIKKFRDFIAVNYQELSVCSSARDCGETEDISVYQFLREPLIRAFGQELYDELCLAAEELERNLYRRKD